MMSDGRRRLLIPGLLAVLTIAVALISATALTGPENALPTRVFGSILATLALAVGIASLALTLRSAMRQALTGLGARMKEQTKHILTGHSQDLQALSTRLEDIERAQRRLINFLRREGNIQFVLDRMQASERRLLNSVESSALTTSGELSRSVDQAHSGLREWLRAEVLDGGALRSELSTISHGSQAVGLLVETLDTKTNEIAGRMDALASVMDRVRAENTKSFESLGDVTSRAADSSASTMQEISLLHEEFRPLFKQRADSRQ